MLARRHIVSHRSSPRPGGQSIFGWSSIEHVKQVRCWLIILTFAVAACNGSSEQQGADHQAGPADTPTIQNSPHTGTPAVTTPLDTGAQQMRYLPQEKKDSISIEGRTQPMTLKLIHPPNADPPFTTYIPSDFVFEETSSGEGTGYYFYTNFGGSRAEDAYLLLYVFPANTTREDAIARVKAWVASRSANVQPAQFGQFGFQNDGKRYFAGIDLRLHSNRYYYVARQYPVEMGDGFGPRARKITDNWTWLI